MRDEWWTRPPMSPTERLRVYGLATPNPESLLTGPAYDVEAHYVRVKALYDAYRYREARECDEFTDFLMGLVREHAERAPNREVTAKFRAIVDQVLTLEGFYRPTFHHRIDAAPTPDWIVTVVRPSLTWEEKFYAAADEAIYIIGQALVSFLIELLDRHAPQAAFAEPDQANQVARVTFIELAHNGSELLESLVSSVLAARYDDGGARLFPTLARPLWDNLIAASGYCEEKLERTRHPKFVLPTDSRLPLDECCEAYLKDTPFLELMQMPLPFDIPDAIRFEHTHLVAGSGHGKTQYLQHMILGFLQRPEPPALIVIDSQGEMLEKIQRLALFAPDGPLADRLVIVDPEDEASPALNMFDTTNARLAGYSRLHREQIEAGVIELYNYIFAAIAAEMTSRQSTAFAFVTRLMLSIPGSTLHSLRELMEEPAQSIEASGFAEAIAMLDPTSRAYFENQFFTRRYADLRQQIARRLYGVLSVPAFDRMFASPDNKLDMFEAIQAGKIVLINTSKALLKSDASALFGRYMIALTIKAVFERVAAKERGSAFLICDEAHEYFDENIEVLLSQARKFNLGVVLAHQHLDQLSTALRSSLAANTSIKLAGGVSDRDARALAPDMRVTPDVITSMRKKTRSTELACYVRNLTPAAIRLEIPFGVLEAAPKMSTGQHTAMRDANRQRYAAGPGLPRQEATGQGEPSEKEGKIDGDDWRS